MPEDGYHGADIIAIGKRLAEEFGDRYAKADEKKVMNSIVNTV